MISRRQEIFFHHLLSACKFFCLQILHNIGGLCRQFFFRCTYGADNLFQHVFSCRQFFSQSRYPPGKDNGPSLKGQKFAFNVVPLSSFRLKHSLTQHICPSRHYPVSRPLCLFIFLHYLRKDIAEKLDRCLLPLN